MTNTNPIQTQIQGIPPLEEENTVEESNGVPSLDEGVVRSPAATNLDSFQATLVDRGINPNANPDLEQATEDFGYQIDFNGPQSIREQMARQVMSDEDKALLDGIQQDPENFGDYAAFYATMQGENDRRLKEIKDGMSREVVNQLNNLQAANEEDGFDLRLEMADTRDFLTAHNEATASNLYIQDRLQQALDETGDQSGLKTVVDFVSSIAPLSGAVAAWRFAGMQGVFGARSQEIDRQYGELLKTPMGELPAKMDEFIETLKDSTSILPGNNSFRVDELLNQFKNIRQNNSKVTDDVINTGFNLIDVGTTPGIGKGFSSITNLLMRTGNKAQIATNTTSVLTKGSDTSLMSIPEAEDMLIKSTLAAGSVPVGINQYMDSVSKVTKRVTDLIREQPVSGLLTKEEAETAIVETTQRFADNLKDGYAVNLDLTDHSLDTFKTTIGSPLPKVSLFVSKPDGSGWLTKKAGENALKRLGIQGEVIFDTGSKEYMIKSVQDIDIDTRKINILSTDTFTAPVLKDIASTAATLDKTLTTMSSVNRGAGENLSHFKNELSKTFLDLKLSKEEAGKLNEVWERGNKTDTWYTEKELRQSGFNDKQVAGYSLAKYVNDLAWDMNNRSLYLDRKARGFKEVYVNSKALKIDEETVPARIYDTLQGIDNAPNLRIYDTESGGFVPQATVIKKLEKGSYKIVRFEGDGVLNAVGDPVAVAIVPTKQLTSQELKKVQMHYQAGGRRYYKDRHFVKQGNITAYSDDPSRKIVNTPRTFGVSSNATDAGTYAKAMNTAMDAFKKMEGLAGKRGASTVAQRAALEATIHDNTGWTYKQMQRMIDRGDLSREPFEVVFGDDLPSSLQTANRTTGNVQFVDPLQETLNRQYFATPGVDRSMLARSRGFRLQRGEVIKDLDGNDAAMLDVFEATDRTLGRAIQSGVWDSWRTRSVNSWLNSVEQLKALGAKVGNNDKVVSIFEGVVFDSKTTNPALRKQIDSLEQQRKDILRVLNTKTKYQVSWETTLRKYTAGIEKTTGLRTTQWDINAKDPTNALRAFAFHTRLGMFNPTQALLQASQIATSFAIDPLSAPQGLKGMYVLSLAQKNPEAAKSLAKKLGSVFGNQADNELMVDEFLKSGFGQIGRTAQQLDDVGVGSSWVNKNLFSKTLDKGRMFFDAGESLSRTYAYGMAWNRVQKANKGLDMTSDLGRRLVNKEASMLTFNMTNEFAAQANRGLLALPLQFKTYMFRTAEIMMGKQISHKERASLIIGSALMYGSDGVPVIDTAWQFYTDNNGADMNPEALKLMNSGLLDYSLSSILGSDTQGGDTNFSSKVGLGQSLTDEFKRLGLLGDEGSASSVAEFATGPAGGQVPTMYSTVRNIVSYLGAEQGAFPELALDELNQAATSLIGSWSAGTKAYYAFHTERAINMSTMEEKGKVDRIQALNYLLGIPPQLEEDIGSQFRVIRNSNEAIDEVAKSVLRLRREAFAVMESDPELFQTKLKAAASLMSNLPIQDRIKISERVHSKFNREQGYEGMAAKVLKANPNAAINKRDN